MAIITGPSGGRWSRQAVQNVLSRRRARRRRSTRDEFQNLLGGGAVIFTEQAHLSFSDSVDLTRCSGVGPKPSHVGGGASRGASR